MIVALQVSLQARTSGNTVRLGALGFLDGRSMDDWEKMRELIDLARGGSREAFDGIVERYRGKLDTWVQGQLGERLRGKVEAEDIIQESLLQAFQSLGRFRGKTEASFRAWLQAIARHVILNQLRRHRLRGEDQPREVPLDGAALAQNGDLVELKNLLRASGTTPERLVRRNERFERLKGALKSLKPDHEKVIRLACIEGLPMKVVAKKLDRSSEAASMLLLRALLKLKMAFGGTESFGLPGRSLEEEEGGPRGG